VLTRDFAFAPFSAHTMAALSTCTNYRGIIVHKRVRLFVLPLMFYYRHHNYEYFSSYKYFYTNNYEVAV